MDLREVDQIWGRTANKWVWSTRAEYVFEEDGSEREDLEPVAQVEASDYTDESFSWTCHPETKADDLAVLYRSAGRGPVGEKFPVVGPKDLAYVFLATSDAFPLADDPLAGKFADRHGCRAIVVARFAPPIGIDRLRNDSVTANWGALKAGFVKSAMSLPDDVWSRLVELDSESVPSRPPNSGTAKRRTERPKPGARRRVEADLEAWLFENPEALRPLGLDLVVHGRQILCEPDHGGSIDLLCIPTGSPRTAIVLELKAGVVRRDAIAQAAGYVGWLRSRPQFDDAFAVVIGTAAHQQVGWVVETLPDDLVQIATWDEIALPPELEAQL